MNCKIIYEYDNDNTFDVVNDTLTIYNIYP